jgi:hypothetical protein
MWNNSNRVKIQTSKSRHTIHLEVEDLFITVIHQYDVNMKHEGRG